VCETQQLVSSTFDQQDDALITSLTSRSEAETLELGQKLGQVLPNGSTVALCGELGAGKTWLAKGIAFGLGVPKEEYVTSPAYDLVHEYRGRLPVYHMDFYRLDTLPEDSRMWLEEYFERDGVCVIEWADKFLDLLPNDYVRVDLDYGKGEQERAIRITAVGRKYADMLKEF
jgi:tRNA threonylcarbamoyladenosine biosynthesis protein TsaE